MLPTLIRICCYLPSQHEYVGYYSETEILSCERGTTFLHTILKHFVLQSSRNLINQWTKTFFFSWHSIPCRKELRHTEHLTWQRYDSTKMNVSNSWVPEYANPLTKEEDYFANATLTAYYACASKIRFKQNYSSVVWYPSHVSTQSNIVCICIRTVYIFKTLKPRGVTNYIHIQYTVKRDCNI